MQGLAQTISVYLQGAVWFAYPTAFVAGLLSSFTPCVYPTIPIIIGYIGGQRLNSKRAGFFFSFIYVLGLSITYSLLGALSAMTGRMFGEVQNSPWTYVIVGNIIIIFGLSMLGAFTINLPTLGFFGETKKGGSFWGAITLGMASGFIVAPCALPVLAVLLTYVATTQNVLIGTSLLFVYAIGMGSILLFAGTFTAILTRLPTSGRWMVFIQRVFGWFMIFLGEFYLIKAGKLWYF